jgi:hypothetical protein
MDDDFMKRCLRDNTAAVACILQIIMKKPDLRVLSVVVEDTIPSLHGRGIRLDVHATDAQQREYDIEIQRSDKGAGRKRARFNSSLLDQDSLSSGEDWENCQRRMSYSSRKMTFSNTACRSIISSESSPNCSSHSVMKSISSTSMELMKEPMRLVS